MSADHHFSLPDEGVYILLCKKVWATEKPSPDLYGDPGDEDEMREQYFKMGGNFYASVLFLLESGDEIIVNDHTQKFVAMMQEVADDHDRPDITEDDIPPPLTLTEPSIIHIAKWPDGAYGSCARGVNEEGMQSMLDRIDAYMESYHKPTDDKRPVGEVIRITQDHSNWSAQKIMSYPKLDRGDAKNTMEM